ncbi:MAG: putative phosphoribosyltransferase [Parcubacteria group bacterium]|nr:putative phosphoribosyltransferase [Parcubacteria group bacterium]
MKLILDAVFPPRESEVRVRTCSADTLITLLSPAVVPGESHGAVGLLPYGNVMVQACVLEAKFHGNVRATQLLAHVLHEYLFEFITETKEFSQEKIIFVPIPLSRSRKRERGYNQTEQIARHAIIGLEEYISLESDLLARTRETLPQTTLGGDARRLNIKGAFVASRPCNPTHTYIVFDDVITTGATLATALEALTNAGAQHIAALALAR